ncbi:hypothetical protein ACJIZ3_013683 [Penstemon smallii]|uniref:EF-hand domain-containing protein n=1 Tax=Penstemon smallii TaxID=265156 RepID=A0ABD3RU83_9LAMI
MHGIREIATAYYERANDKEKQLVKEFFNKLDLNGDGKISLVELRRHVGCSISNENIFNQLDVNGDGTLDFHEALSVYYMVNHMSLLVCSGCYGLLVGPYFSCLLCLGKGPETYDLCCACYGGGQFEHEHSTNYLLNHHSLLAVLRERTTDAETNKGKKKMEELREIAKAHYRAGSPEIQTLAYQFFQSMDTDGDGRVDLQEFLTFMRQQGYPQMRNAYFFNQLDQDGNGTLDFSEVMTLYYIVKSGRPFCDCCGNFIPGIYFSCVECFKNPKSPFNICRDCYKSAKCSHNHNNRVQFLDNYTLLQATRDSALAKATGVNQNEIWATSSSNATAPIPQSNGYLTTWQQPYNYTYNVPSAPNYSNAIVPASNKMVSIYPLALTLFEGL